MPRGRMAMESIEEILRLHHECKRSQREIARSCGLSAGAVNGLLQRAARAGLGWPLPEGLEPGQLHERLYGTPAGGRRAALDCAAMHKELSRRRHLTLRLLWEEYRAAQPEGYGYSQDCELYRQWKARRAPAMLQEHKAGEKLFVDYAGQTVPVRDPAGGARRRCSWRCWGRVRTATPKSAGGRAWRAGSRRTCVRSSISEAVPRCSCPIMFPGT